MEGMRAQHAATLVAAGLGTGALDSQRSAGSSGLHSSGGDGDADFAGVRRLHQVHEAELLEMEADHEVALASARGEADDLRRQLQSAPAVAGASVAGASNGGGGVQHCHDGADGMTIAGEAAAAAAEMAADADADAAERLAAAEAVARRSHQRAEVAGVELAEARRREGELERELEDLRAHAAAWRQGHDEAGELLATAEDALAAAHDAACAGREAAEAEARRAGKAEAELQAARWQVAELEHRLSDLAFSGDNGDNPASAAAAAAESSEQSKAAAAEARDRAEAAAGEARREADSLGKQLALLQQQQRVEEEGAASPAAQRLRSPAPAVSPLADVTNSPKAARSLSRQGSARQQRSSRRSLTFTPPDGNGRPDGAAEAPSAARRAQARASAVQLGVGVEESLDVIAALEEQLMAKDGELAHLAKAAEDARADAADARRHALDMQAMVEELQAGYERLDHAAKNASEVHEEERAKRHAEAAALRRDAGLRSLQVQGLEGQIAALEEEARDGLVRHHRLLAEHQRLRLQAARLEAELQAETKAASAATGELVVLQEGLRSAAKDRECYEHRCRLLEDGATRERMRSVELEVACLQRDAALVQALRSCGASASGGSAAGSPLVLPSPSPAAALLALTCDDGGASDGGATGGGATPSGRGWELLPAMGLGTCGVGPDTAASAAGACPAGAAQGGAVGCADACSPGLTAVTHISATPGATPQQQQRQAHRLAVASTPHPCSSLSLAEACDDAASLSPESAVRALCKPTPAKGRTPELARGGIGGAGCRLSGGVGNPLFDLTSSSAAEQQQQRGGGSDGESATSGGGGAIAATLPLSPLLRPAAAAGFASDGGAQGGADSCLAAATSCRAVAGSSGVGGARRGRGGNVDDDDGSLSSVGDSPRYVDPASKGGDDHGAFQLWGAGGGDADFCNVPT